MRPKENCTARGMIEELARHGYPMSPGTLYPLLHGLEKKGSWVHAWSVTDAQPESIIRQTVSSRGNQIGTVKATELFGEIVPDQRQPNRAKNR